jgi:superfamily II DNA or RNA helicase
MAEENFKRGDRVRDTYSDKTGHITGKTRPFGSSIRWEVDLGDSEPQYIRENDLELISDDDDMFSLFEQCRFSGVLDLRRIIQHIRLNGDLTNIFYSMHNSSTIFMAHQFKPVMKFIESASGRLLIADEVGLGKTIEAIYIWKELLTRENAKRFLIICPAQLCQKWKDDLRRYFNIHADILGAKDLLDRLKESLLNYNSDSFVVISSIQGIRYRELEVTIPAGQKSRAELNDFFERFDIENNNELFDLVVIDEAHYLRNSTTASFSTGERIRDISRYMVLLSATPIQTSSDNLFNLLRLLAPEDYYSRATFNELLKENRLVVALANAIRKNRTKNEIKKIYDDVKDKIRENPALEKTINSYLKNENNTTEERMSLFNTLKDSNFYSQYFTRTRKRDVFEGRITRAAQTLDYSFSGEEYAMYQEVTRHLQSLAVGGSNIFTLIARQRQMTSCLPAALKHWKDNDVLQEILYEDMGLDDAESPNSGTTIDIPDLNMRESIIKRFEDNDSKYKKLLSELSKIIAANKREKVIIFSFYRYTIKYLYDRLTNDGFTCEMMMGGIGDEKEKIIEHFRDSPACNILISSEVGSEGIDLQFASIEINYDLPWNPMRLEQRIGRIDRIGQEKEKIRILNFMCQNTIEDRVLDRLYERIDIFKHSIGDIEEILGNRIHEISVELLTSNLNDKEKEEQAYQKIEAIANNKIELEKLEEQAGLSAEFSDIILENINNANNNKRYIMAGELIQYTKDFFNLNYSGTRIEDNDENSLLITLSQEAQIAFRDYIRANHYRTVNLGYRTDALLCIFNGNRDAYRKYKIFEIIDINHPFIKWMKSENRNKTANVYDCSAVKVRSAKAGGIVKGIYAYYIQRWISEGYRNTNELKFFVINIETRSILDENIAENLVVLALTNGTDLSEIKYGLQNFDTICYSLEKSREYAYSLFEVFEKNFHNENNIVCERNVDYLRRTFERKYASIIQQIENARQNGLPERIVRMNKGKLAKAQEVHEIQLRKLEEKKSGRCSFSDIVAGIIKVEE